MVEIKDRTNHSFKAWSQGDLNLREMSLIFLMREDEI
jgi:hypothetical protein